MNRQKSRRTRNSQAEFDSYLSRFRKRYKLRIIATAIAAVIFSVLVVSLFTACLLYTSPSPRDGLLSRMPSSA